MYHVSDGIDQCHVGFLQRHFVAHAKRFDDVLAQVTEVYSAGSRSPIKQKKWRHNMGCCCLAALIFNFLSAAKCSTSKATTAFLAKVAKGEEDSAEEMALLTRLGGDKDNFVSYDDNPPGATMIDSSTMRTAQQHENHDVQDFTSTTSTGAPAPEQCHTPPPAKDANKSA